MTFVWRHPKYYAELKEKLKEQQASENNQESESNDNKELDDQNQE